MTRTTNDTKISFKAKTAIIGAGFAVLAALIATTSILNYAGDQHDAPAPVSTAESAFPLESAKDAFLRSMTNCGIEQGYGAAIAFDDSTPRVPAALAVRIPRVMDAAGATTEQFSCLATQLSMPLLLVDRMTDDESDTGQSAWVTQASGSMAAHWTRGPGGLIVVISGQGEQDGAGA